MKILSIRLPRVCVAVRVSVCVRMRVCVSVCVSGWGERFFIITRVMHYRTQASATVGFVRCCAFPRRAFNRRLCGIIAHIMGCGLKRLHSARREIARTSGQCSEHFVDLSQSEYDLRKSDPPRPPLPPPSPSNGGPTTAACQVGLLLVLVRRVYRVGRFYVSRG